MGRREDERLAELRLQGEASLCPQDPEGGKEFPVLVRDRKGSGAWSPRRSTVAATAARQPCPRLERCFFRGW